MSPSPSAVRVLVGVGALIALLLGPPALGVRWMGSAGGSASIAFALVAIVVTGWPRVRAWRRVSASPLDLPGWNPCSAVLPAAALIPFVAVAPGGSQAPVWLLVAVAAACLALGALRAWVDRRAAIGDRRTPVAHACLALAVVVAAPMLVPEPGSRSASGARGAEAQPTPGELTRVRLQLAGPLRSASVSVDGCTPLALTAQLRAGETRSTFGWMLVPGDLVQSGDLSRPLPIELLALDPPAADGPSARAAPIVVRLADSGNGGGSDFDALLVGRAGPSLPQPRLPLPWEAMLFALTVVVAQLSLMSVTRAAVGQHAPWRQHFLPRQRFLRRQGLAAIGIVVLGVVGTIGARSLSAELGADASGAVDPGESAAPVDAIRVLECDRLAARPADGARWLQLDRMRGRADLPAELTGQLRVDRDHQTANRGQHVANCGLDVGPGGARVTISARRAGAPVDLFRAFEPGFRVLTRDVNTWGALDGAWTRSAAGTWSSHGAWPLGDPLPPPAEDGPEWAPMPTWAGRQLPMGRSILIARIAPGSYAGATIAGQLDGSAPEVWLRLTGF